MKLSQTERPSHFNNCWRIAGAIDEHEHALKFCAVIGYELDDDGQDVVRVRLEGGLPGQDEVLIAPHMLLPFIAGRPG